MAIWTIGMVNHKCSYYLPYQMKSLWNYNKHNFKVIIVNNSGEDLTHLKEFGDVTIINNCPPRARYESAQHGEGLNIILSKLDPNTHLLVQDPDFFWAKCNYLDMLEEYINAGKIAVGVEFHAPQVGHPLFPYVVACAYRKGSLEPGSFSPGDDFQQILAEGKDVGWQIRYRLAPWFHFHTFRLSYMADLSNIKSYQIGGGKKVAVHKDGEEIIGYHTIHGCWSGAGGNNHQWPPPEIVTARTENAEYFHSLLEQNCKKL